MNCSFLLDCFLRFILIYIQSKYRGCSNACTIFEATNSFFREEPSTVSDAVAARVFPTRVLNNHIETICLGGENFLLLKFASCSMQQAGNKLSCKDRRRYANAVFPCSEG